MLSHESQKKHQEKSPMLSTPGLTIPNALCKSVLTLAGVQPGPGTLGLHLGRPLNVGGLYCSVPPQGLSLEASLTCFRGEDQLLCEPPATMFHSQLKFYSIPSKGAGSPGSHQQDELAAINVSSGD